MSTYKCCAPGCNSRHIPKALQNEFYKEQRVSFHRIPSTKSDCSKKKELRAKWLAALSLDGSKISKTAHVCSLHFLPEEIYRLGTLVTLRENVVPSIFHHFAQNKPVHKKRPPKPIVLPVINKDELQKPKVPIPRLQMSTAKRSLCDSKITLCNNVINEDYLIPLQPDKIPRTSEVDELLPAHMSDNNTEVIYEIMLPSKPFDDNVVSVSNNSKCTPLPAPSTQQEKKLTSVIENMSRKQYCFADETQELSPDTPSGSRYHGTPMCSHHHHCVETPTCSSTQHCCVHHQQHYCGNDPKCYVCNSNDTPTNIKLKEQLRIETTNHNASKAKIKDLRKKLRTLQQMTRRYKQKIASYEDVISDLRIKSQET